MSLKSIWIASSEALALVVARTGNVVEAEFVLNAALKAGKLKARCRTMVNEFDVGPIKLEIPTGTSHRVKSVRTFDDGSHASLNFATSASAHVSGHEPSPFRWEHGVFAIVNPPIAKLKMDPNGSASVPACDRFVFYGVEFDFQDVRELARSTPSKLPKTRGRNGPSREKFDFAPLMKDLKRMVKEGAMAPKFGDVNDYGAQAKIEKHIFKSFTDWSGGPSESTVRRKAQAIMHLWRLFPKGKIDLLRNEPL